MASKRSTGPRLQWPSFPGGVPERPKGAVCKTAGSAYGGSNPPAPTSLQGGRARIDLSALLAQLVEHLHGKEGVDGSSPSEGFSVSSCSGAVSVVLIGDDGPLRRPSDVQGLDVGGLDVRVTVEESDCVLASVACEVAVMAVDHGQAGSHVAREVEGRDAGA